MSHTLPDFTTKYKLAKIFGQIDSGELAARQGINSFADRRGNIVWYDDFEAADAVKWSIAPHGAGTGAISTLRAWMGNSSLLIITDANVGDDVAVSKTFCLPPERRIGAEWMFNISMNEPRITFHLIGYTGTTRFIGGVRYDFNLNKLYYYNSAGAYIELTIYDSTTITYYPWLLLKLAIDCDKQEYIRLIFCGTEYDLSGIPLNTIASADPKRVRVQFYTEARTAAAAKVHFDNFILTQNEP